MKKLFILYIGVVFSLNVYANPVVMLYQHDGYNGNALTLDIFTGSYSTYPSIGRYWNDRVSSFKVKKCIKVSLYEHINYGGLVLTYEGPITINHMPRTPMNWNDKISSAVVSKVCDDVSPHWP